MKLPVVVLYKIFSYLSLREIYKRIARLSKDTNILTTQPNFIRLLQSIYLQKMNLPLSKAKKQELPFYGFQTDAHCPNPEQWVDQIFMRTSNSLVILQNCKYIKGCLSKQNQEFKKKIFQFVSISKQYLPDYQKERLYDVQIAKIYELSYTLSSIVFDLDNVIERAKITEVISYFWDRIKINQRQIQQQQQQNILPDYKGIIKEISISLAPGHTQVPKLILISSNNDTNILNKTVLRTNMKQFQAIARSYKNQEGFSFEYCIFKQEQGALVLIDMKDQLQVKLKLQNNETQIVQGIQIHILENQILQEGQQPGAAFQYISFSGYLLD